MLPQTSKRTPCKLHAVSCQPLQISDVWVLCFVLVETMTVSSLSWSSPSLVLAPPPTGPFSAGGEVYHHPRLLQGRNAARRAKGSPTEQPLQVETGPTRVLSTLFAVAVVTAARPDSQGQDHRHPHKFFQIFLVVFIEILGLLFCTAAPSLPWSGSRTLHAGKARPPQSPH